ncbi:MAG: hypothetical protein ABI867_35080, partial [Kofleriaceae bacterium]
MGWLGKLFTKGPRKPPAWARDAFGDGATFDAFVDVVLDALEAAGHAASEMDVRTGSVMLATGEWIIEGTARDCAQCEPSRWPGIVAKSLARDDGDNADIPAPAVIPRISQVVGYMAMGDLERAEAIAVEAIAAGERVGEMHHQRAMIALMRGDDAAADAELALIDTPQALSSR